MEKRDIIKNKENASYTTENIYDDRFSSETLLKLWIKDALNKKEEQKNQI